LFRDKTFTFPATAGVVSDLYHLTVATLAMQNGRRIMTNGTI